MRILNLIEEKQPDGSIHHISGLGCPLEPCVDVKKEGMVPVLCDCLFSDGVDENEKIIHKCNKPPCRSGA
jgi:hypothetical protein